MTKQEKRLRNKIVQKGRTEMDRQIKDGIYIELKRKEYGLMDTEELIADKEFLENLIVNENFLINVHKAIEKKQTKKSVGG